MPILNDPMALGFPKVRVEITEIYLPIDDDMPCSITVRVKSTDDGESLTASMQLHVVEKEAKELLHWFSSLNDLHKK